MVYILFHHNDDLYYHQEIFLNKIHICFNVAVISLPTLFIPTACMSM